MLPVNKYLLEGGVFLCFSKASRIKGAKLETAVFTSHTLLALRKHGHLKLPIRSDEC